MPYGQACSALSWLMKHGRGWCCALAGSPVCSENAGWASQRAAFLTPWPLHQSCLEFLSWFLWMMSPAHASDSFLLPIFTNTQSFLHRWTPPFIKCQHIWSHTELPGPLTTANFHFVLGIAEISLRKTLSLYCEISAGNTGESKSMWGSLCTQSVSSDEFLLEAIAHTDLVKSLNHV